MHLWSIRKLKDALHTGPLSARQALPYLLVWMVLTVGGAYVPSYAASTTEPAPWTTWDVLDVLGGLLLTVATVVLFYRANGGAGGTDLMTRFIAINLVVSLRVAAISLPILFAAVGWWYVLGPGAQSEEWTTADELLFLAVGLSLQTVIMWRTVRHGRDLRAEAHDASGALGGTAA